LIDGGVRLPESSARKQQLLIAAVFFCTFAGAGAVQPYVVPLLECEGGDVGRGSLVLAAVYLTFALARQFVALVVPRLGMSRGVRIGSIGYALFVLALLACRSFGLLLAASVVWGLTASLFWGCTSMRVLELAQDRRYGKAAGRLYFATRAGMIVGVLAQGWLHRSGVAGRAAYLHLLLWAVTASTLAAALTLGLPPAQDERLVSTPPQYRRWLTDRRMLTVVFCLTMSALAYGLCLRQLNTQIEAHIGASNIGLVLMPFYVMQALVSMLSGSLSDRFGREPVWCVGFLLGAAGTFLGAAGGHWVAFMVSAGLLGCMFGTIPTVALAWIGDLTTKENRLPLHGFLFGWRDIGVAIPLLAGAWFQNAVVLPAIGVATLCCALLIWFIPRGSAPRAA